MQQLKLSELSIEQKIGQMLIARPPRSKADKAFIVELLKNKALGGIQITDYFRLVTGKSDLEQSDRDMIAEFQEIAGYPLLIFDDMEYGFSGGKAMLPSPLGIGSIGTEEAAYEFARITAIEAKAAGYNGVFGPMMDIAMNPESSCVGARAFGGNKEIVARLAAAAVRGYQDEGLLVTAKHFPGSGAEKIDNHIRLAPLNRTEEEILQEDVIPYMVAMKEANLSGIMMGQNIVPAIDPDFPATLSAKVNRFLRERIGYKGLVITDSFTMVSLRNQFTLAECLRYGMAAGNDMVMTSYREDCQPAYEAMLAAYREGYVTEEQINTAVSHVLEAQAKTLKSARQNDVTEREIEIADRMNRESITASVRGVKSAAVDTKQKYLILIEEGCLCDDPVKGRVREYDGILNTAEEEIRKRFTNADILHIPEFPCRNVMFDLLRKSIHYDKIIMVVYNKSVAYTGSSDLTRRMLAYMEGVSEKLEAVVLFGSPYAAREFPFVPRIIYGYYESPLCQKYAIQALAGELEPKGKLPVSVQLREK